MRDKLTANTIRGYAREVANVSVPEERAAEIGPGGEGLNRGGGDTQAPPYFN